MGKPSKRRSTEMIEDGTHLVTVDDQKVGHRMAQTTFRNWKNSASSTPQVVATPRNLQELIDVVKDTAAYPSSLRVRGMPNSWRQLGKAFCHIASKTIPAGDS